MIQSALKAYAIRPVVLHHDGTDVVATALRQGRVDQRVRRRFWCGCERSTSAISRSSSSSFRPSLHRSSQSRLRSGSVDLRGLRGADTERLRHEILVRMAAQLRLGQMLLFPQDFQERMVAGQLPQRSAAPEISATVADPCDLRRAIGNAGGDQRRSHIVVCRVARRGRSDCLMRQPDLGNERVVHRAAEQRLLHDAAGDVAAGMSTHAVGDEPEAVSFRSSRWNPRSGLRVFLDVSDRRTACW